MHTTHEFVEGYSVDEIFENRKDTENDSKMFGSQFESNVGLIGIIWPGCWEQGFKLEFLYDSLLL